MSIELTVLISIVSALVGIVGGVATMQHRNKEEVQEETAEKSVAIYEIQKIGEDVKEIKHSMGGFQRQLMEVRDKAILTERDVQTLHTRVDRLEEKAV